MQQFVEKLKRGLRKPPRVIAKRAYTEMRSEMDRWVLPFVLSRFDLKRLLKLTKTQSMDNLWHSLAATAFPWSTKLVSTPDLNRLSETSKQTIFEKSKRALLQQVDLLGSGVVSLGREINWTCDYKAGYTWLPGYFKDIDYNLKGNPCDVKFPWELSRLQWMIPVGQAYLLTGDESYAQFAKTILHDWIKKNPIANTVNWSCTMEVAMRIMVWTWFFHTFKHSKAWEEHLFRENFLLSLYRHALFTERNLEISDVNGNHLTADAAGLVFAGCFWRNSKDATRWLKCGWSLLEREIKYQVTPDGVDFEGSVPYHRLVLELFFLAARYRTALQYPISDAYKHRLIKMAEYTAAYTRPDGSTPLLGDADDARVLPFGEQSIDDHRYLIGWIGCQFNVKQLLERFSGPSCEIFWLQGEEAVVKVENFHHTPVKPVTTFFKESGMVVLCNEKDHVFIDCAPVGLANRGGHGHNDCLSLSVMLDNTSLITDCGAYVYTADYEKRNLFRSTAFHNTPCVDHEEINRFIHPDYLWNLHADAVPVAKHFSNNDAFAVFQGEHTGYLRLSDPVLVQRQIVLDHLQHAIFIEDILHANGNHHVDIPLHLEPTIKPQIIEPGKIIFDTPNGKFILLWEGSDNWQVDIFEAWVSPSYGLMQETQKLRWHTHHLLPASLQILIFPATADCQMSHYIQQFSRTLR